MNGLNMDEHAPVLLITHNDAARAHARAVSREDEDHWRIWMELKPPERQHTLALCRSELARRTEVNSILVLAGNYSRVETARGERPEPRPARLSTNRLMISATPRLARVRSEFMEDSYIPVNPLNQNVPLQAQWEDWVNLARAITEGVDETHPEPGQDNGEISKPEDPQASQPLVEITHVEVVLANADRDRTLSIALREWAATDSAEKLQLLQWCRETISVMVDWDDLLTEAAIFAEQERSGENERRTARNRKVQRLIYGGGSRLAIRAGWGSSNMYEPYCPRNDNHYAEGSMTDWQELASEILRLDPGDPA